VDVPEGEQITTAEWSADGRSLLFGKSVRTDDQHRTTELWRVPASGGEPRNLGLAMENLRSLGVHPDGRQSAFITGRSRNDVWVMENFLAPVEAEPLVAP
jgi:Tol biopolymer transport system component